MIKINRYSLLYGIVLFASTSDAETPKPILCVSHAQCPFYQTCQDNLCRPAKGQECGRYRQCKLKGLCEGDSNVQCVAANPQDCQYSAQCRAIGECGVLNGQCVATGEGCQKSEACSLEGMCGLGKSGLCAPRGENDCRASKACATRGACSPKDGMCFPAHDLDCKLSHDCKAKGRCRLEGNDCKTD